MDRCYNLIAMSPKKEKTVSAQVILLSASGKSVTGQEAITAENVQDFMPSRESFATAARSFQEAGFEVSAPGPTGFSITAPADLFEKFFKTRLRREESGAVKAQRKDESTAFELPLRALPRELAQLVEAVTFTPPPDFGPGNF